MRSQEIIYEIAKRVFLSNLIILQKGKVGKGTGKIYFGRKKDMSYVLIMFQGLFT